MTAPKAGAKVGRPKLSEGKARSTVLQIRLTPSERILVERLAKRYSMSPSAFARVKLIAACEID